MSKRIFLSVILTLGLALPAWAQRDRSSANALLTPFKSVVAAANAATVRIVMSGDSNKDESLATQKEVALGTVVDPDGYVLTKASELRGDIRVKLGDGSLLEAKLVGSHKPTDLALLKIDMKGLKPVAFSDSKKIPVGNWLAAAGLDTKPVEVGIVSVTTREFKRTPNEDELRNQNRGYLSITMAKKDDPEGGAIVEVVTKDGAAAKAGLKTGDVITEVDGYEVSGQKALRDLLEGYRPGDKLTVTIRREDETLDLKAKLTGPPVSEQNRSEFQNTMGGGLSGRRSGFPAVLQTDMVIDPKNCGGPVVDLDGKVLGITIARAGRVETWVLPSETIRPILADLKAGKYPPIAPKKVVKKVTDPSK